MLLSISSDHHKALIFILNTYLIKSKASSNLLFMHVGSGRVEALLKGTDIVEASSVYDVSIID